MAGRALDNYWFRCVSLLTLCVLLSTTSGQDHSAPNILDGDRATPQDLQLDPEFASDSEVLSNYAWGFFLRLQDGLGSEEALEYLLRALRERPDSEPVLQSIVVPLIRSRQFDRIVTILRPLAAEFPEHAKFQLLVSESLVASGKRDEGIAVLEEAWKANGPESASILRQLFVYYWQDERFDEVERILNEARKRGNIADELEVLQASAAYHNARANLPKADLTAAERRKLQQKALDYARKAVDRVDLDTDLKDVRSLANLLTSMDAVDDVLVLLENAGLTADGGSRMPGDLAILKAECLLKAGRKAEAVQVLEQFRLNAEDNLRVLLAASDLLQEAGEFERAAAILSAILSRRPNFHQLRMPLAYLLLRLDDPAGALRVVRSLAEPADAVHMLRSHAYYEQGELDKALEEMTAAEQAARKSGNDQFFSVDFYLFYATLYEESGRVDEAIEQVRTAAQLAPSEPVVANFLGYVLADHGRDLAEAEIWIGKAIAAEPDNVAYVDSLAWVYFRQGRSTEALREILRCLRLGGDDADPVILDHAGDICRENGLDLLARRYWWGAIQTDPKPADRERIREKLAR